LIIKRWMMLKKKQETTRKVSKLDQAKDGGFLLSHLGSDFPAPFLLFVVI
jgi:hypothetical protein